MKTYLIPALFLSLLSRVQLSNPDSEIVQDNSDSEAEGGTQKSAPMKMLDDDVQSATSGGIRGRYEVPRVRVFRPVRTGVGVVWQEIGLSERLDRWKDSSFLYGMVRRMRYNGTVTVSDSFRGQTSVVANRPQRPWNDARRPNDPVAPENRNPYGQTNNGGIPSSGGGQVLRNRHASYGGQNPGIVHPGFSGKRLGYGHPVRSEYAPSGTQNPSSVQTGHNGRIPGNDQDVRYVYGPNGNVRVVTSGYALSGSQNPSNVQPGHNRKVVANTIPNGDSGRRVMFGTSVPQNNRDGPSPPRRTGASPDSNLFSGIINDFAFKLVEAMNLKSNFVVSPLSIYIALSMCYLGSEGQSEAQLARALGLDEYNVHGQHLHQGIRDLVSLIRSESSEQLQLLVANGMFLGRNFITEQQFQQEIQRYYQAELMNLDFGKPDLSMSVINDWVSRNTRNMITSLISSPPSLETRLILMNAVYFKGVWKTQFPADLTSNRYFNTLDGNVKEVPTMVLREETFPLYRSDDQRHSFIKLPYSGDQVSMIIALPYELGDDPMPSSRDQTLCYVRDAMKDTKLDTVTLPKFRLESTQSLVSPLMQLGIRDIFDPRFVNLRKLRKQNDVSVSQILHKAVLDVNEEGTTAAAVTEVRFVTLASRNTTDFMVNHPFAFYVIHESSGLVLFYGKVYDLGVISAVGNRRPRPNSDNTPPFENAAVPPNNASPVNNAPGNSGPSVNNAPGNNVTPSNNAPGNNAPSTNSAPGNNIPSSKNAPSNNTPPVNNAPGNNVFIKQ